jgi:hypothetical protein
MTALMHHDTPEAPAVPTKGPRFEVDRVSAVDCEAPAVERVGTHCVCAYHQQDVRLAYWGTDANLILHKILPSEYFLCGDVYTSPEVTR